MQRSWGRSLTETFEASEEGEELEEECVWRQVKDHALHAMVEARYSFPVRWEPGKESSRDKSIIDRL